STGRPRPPPPTGSAGSRNAKHALPEREDVGRGHDLHRTGARQPTDGGQPRDLRPCRLPPSGGDLVAREDHDPMTRGGKMGARTNDPVRTIMGAPVVALEPETTLGTAAMVLRDKQIGALAVVGGGRLLGLLSERDVVAAVAEGADTDVVTVADVMSDHP